MSITSEELDPLGLFLSALEFPVDLSATDNEWANLCGDSALLLQSTVSTTSTSSSTQHQNVVVDSSIHIQQHIQNSVIQPELNAPSSSSSLSSSSPSTSSTSSTSSSSSSLFSLPSAYQTSGNATSESSSLFFKFDDQDAFAIDLPDLQLVDEQQQQESQFQMLDAEDERLWSEIVMLENENENENGDVSSPSSSENEASLSSSSSPSFTVVTHMDETASSGKRSNGKPILTNEEMSIFIKEGYPIPTKAPLTKSEEKLLTFVRRKIRNKRSAHNSREKKKVYVDGLEKRVDQCTKENQDLQRKVKLLTSQNLELMGKLKKTQLYVNALLNRHKKSSSAVLFVALLVTFLVYPQLDSTEYSSPVDAMAFNTASVIYESAGSFKNVLTHSVIMPNESRMTIGGGGGESTPQHNQVWEYYKTHYDM